MADTQTSIQTQTIQENPKIEAYRIGLLKSVRDFINSQMGPGGTRPPVQQVAALSPMQQRAAQLGMQGVGSYEPYMREGLRSSLSGQEVLATSGLGGLQEAYGATREGQRGLSEAARLLQGTGAEFAPGNVQGYFNPYEDIAVQQALGDIRREGNIAQNQLAAQAVGAGAFGGSRSAIAEAELQRNILEQQARTAAQMRQQGYGAAASQAQSAFEAAKDRQLKRAAAQAGLGQQMAATGQGLGGLAGVASGLGEQFGQFGLQQAGLGQLGQQLGIKDIQTLSALGGQEQVYNQAVADAVYKANLGLQQFPYQQYAFLSDIYKGVPSSQQVTTVDQAPQPSGLQSALGLGISGLAAAAGVKQGGGLFGTGT
tara:strand:+ start:77 stop:1186 length:1110 start_codon:yes stop_codon:yes gene_type:complete